MLCIGALNPRLNPPLNPRLTLFFLLSGWCERRKGTLGEPLRAAVRYRVTRREEAWDDEHQEDLRALPGEGARGGAEGRGERVGDTCDLATTCW